MCNRLVTVYGRLYFSFLTFAVEIALDGSSAVWLLYCVPIITGSDGIYPTSDLWMKTLAK